MNMDRMETKDNAIIQAPLDERLQPQKRMEAAVELSQLVTEIVTYVICQTIVNNDELFNNERTAIAHAFLQRVATTHMCNHKLTTEGLVIEYNGQPFQLHEEYKTMTLTRTVYEHLAMFYFLYEHPKTAEERDIVWKYWKTNSKRNNGSIELVREKEKYVVRRVPFSQAWKYLFKNEDMTLMYRHLSMHCHPVYNGLVQYQSQSASIHGEDCIPLYLSTCFLAYLCRLFLKLIPNGESIIKGEFNERDQFLFYAMSHPDL